MNKFYTVEEVAKILEVSPRKVKWLIFIGKLKASRQKSLGVVVYGRDIVDFVYDNPKYDEAVDDKFKWHISEYRKLREYLETGKFPTKKVVYEQR